MKWRGRKLAEMKRSWAAKPAVMEECYCPESLVTSTGQGLANFTFDFNREKDVLQSVVSNLSMGSFAVVDAVAYGSKLLARKMFHSYNSRMKSQD
jgi:hypothetical protein